jgi:very-short-patch-repair endonuclease
MSPAEVLLWRALRTRPGGYKFRHEHAAGFYSLDFYCSKAALCIEVDGDAHDMGENPARDERRDAWLRDEGIETVRIPAREVFDDLEPVVTLIVEKCAARSPSTAYGGPHRRVGHAPHGQGPSGGRSDPPIPQRRGRMS